MKCSFTCYGHENITCRHKATLEFTKDSELSLKGDCIIGVKADFSIKEIKRFIESLGNNNKNYNLKNNVAENKIIEKINAEINPGFDSDKEMVIRKSDFADKRTFAIKADKAACELNAALLGFLKGSRNKIEVIVEKA